MKKSVRVIVDGKNLDAAHFGAMSKEDAIKNMIADSITDDEAWAGEAWEKAKAQLDKAEGKGQKTAAKEATTAARETVQAAKAAEQANAQPGAAIQRK